MTLRIVRAESLVPMCQELRPEVLQELQAYADKWEPTPHVARVLATCLLEIATGDVASLIADGVSEDTLVELEAMFRARGWDESLEVYPQQKLYPETIDRLLLRVQANAFMGELPPLPKRSKGASKLVKAASALDADRLRLLLDIADSKAVLATVKGASYAVHVVPEGFVVQGMSNGDPRHTVLKDKSHCTCEDNRFRGRECKHITALRSLKL